MKKIYFLLFATMLMTVGCKKSLDVSDPTSIGTDEYITDDNTAQLALDGVYDELQYTYYYAYPYMLTGLYSDEFDHTGSYTDMDEYLNNNVSATNAYPEYEWDYYYSIIYRANAVITTLAGLDDGVVTSSVSTQITAEAKALRAFSYFNLVRLFGGVPIPTTIVSDDQSATSYSRSTVDEVYDYILSDLNDADGNVGSSDVFHFSDDAVKVLKAKVYLTQGDYTDAQTALESVIGDYSLLDDYSSLWETGSNDEAILRINYTSDDANDLAFFFYPSTLGGRRECAPNQASIDAFESGDTRASVLEDASSLSDVYLNKYTDISTGTDQPYIYRYSDVLLLYAETLARQGEYTDAATYLNEVRERAGLADTTLTADNYLEVIGHEREVEFYGEGQRWYDVLRLGLTDDVIANKSTSSLNDDRMLWPIPQSEIDANDSISSDDQNPGY